MNPVIKTSSLLLRPSVLAVCLALSSPMLAHTALAQTSKSLTQTFDIPAGSLDATLTRIARQSGQIISIQPEQVQGRSAPAVQGEMSAEQAYRQALKNSGMELFVTGSGAYNLRPAPAGTTTTLPEVKVLAGQETAISPVIGYVAKRSATGTKTDTALIETPMSISIITRDQMDAQAVQTVEQSLRYTAGVLTEITGYDLRYASLNIRGFDATLYRDGLKVFKSGTYGDWLSDPQGVERVEVIKGPSAVLYGQGGPGGLVNQVSKRPTDTPINDVSVAVGNHDRYQTSFDFGRSLNEDGTLLFRVNGLMRDSKTQTKYSQDNRLYVAPSLTWKPNADTSLTLLADVTQDRMTPKSWWPNASLLKTYAGGTIPVDTFAGEPNFDHYNRDMSSIGYLFEHRFDGTLVLRQNMRYARYKLDYQHVFATGVLADNRTVTRSWLISRVDSDSTTIDTNVQKDFSTGPLKHKLLVGFDYQNFSGVELGSPNPVVPALNLDIFNPVYGAAFASQVTTRTTADVKQYGLYVQDQIKFDRWIVNAGLRRDRAETSRGTAAGSIAANDSKTTGSAGLLYLFDNGVAPYASYSTSFAPVIGTNYSVTPQPETGVQYEFGLKYQPVGSNSFITASVFDLRKQNVTTVDPVNVTKRVQTGEVRTRGVELEGKTSLGRQLDVIASYTFLDPWVSKSNDPKEIGKMPFQTARNTAKLWMDYTFLAEPLSGWGIGAGVRRTGRTVADVPYNLYFNAGYTLFDAAIHYQAGPIRFALNAANLFDKVTTANRAQFYGQDRTITATLGYRW